MNTIVAAVDFTVASEAAVREAAHQARVEGARLVVLHVVERTTLLDLGRGLDLPAASVESRIIQDAAASLEGLLPEDERPSDTSFRVSIGRPAADIVAVCGESGADLLVLGVWGTAGPNRGAGTVATRCVRKAPCPVLLVHEDHQPGWKTVVACVDFTSTSRPVVGEAARIAQASSARLCLVHVHGQPWRLRPYARVNHEDPEDAGARMIAALERQTAEWPDELAGVDVVCDIYEHGSHGEGIVQYARWKAADLVVLGTRGPGSLSERLLGSTAERVLRHVECSVLAIRPT